MAKLDAHRSWPRPVLSADHPAAPWVVAALTLTLHFGVLLLMPAAVPPPTPDTLDRYDPIARSLLSGKGFATGGAPTAIAPPLYPLLLALIYAVVGPSLTAVRVVLSGTVAALAAVVVLLGRRVAGGAEGLLAGLVTAVSPYFLYGAFVAGNDAPFALLLTLFLLVLIGAVRNPTPRSFAAAGALLGVATLFRAHSLFLPVLALPVALLLIPRGKRSWWRCGGSFVLAFVLVLAPWTVRNAIRFHRLVPVQTLGGLHLVMATGSGPQPPLAQHEVGAPDEDASHYRIALRRLAAHPGSFGKLVLRRLHRMWYATHSRLHERGLLAANITLLGLAAAGAWSLRTRRQEVVLLLTLVAYFVALHSVTVALFRYMLPTVPALTVLACVPCVRAARIVRRWLSRLTPGVAGLGPEVRP